jgi:transitional endoplasmic reticulum ATPase
MKGGGTMDFITRKKLQYLVNSLTYAKSFINESILEIALKFLNFDQEWKIINSSIQFLEKTGYDKNALAVIVQNCQLDNSATSNLKELYKRDCLKEMLFRAIFAILCRINNRNIDDKNATLIKRLREIGKLFNLNSTEQELLLLVHLINIDSAVATLHDGLNEWLDVRMYKGITARNKWPIVAMTGCKKADIDDALGGSSALLRSYLIDDALEIPTEIAGYLEGSCEIPISTRYFSLYTGEAVPLDSLIIDKRHVSMVKALIKSITANKRINILIYGEPGTGKTEFARSLIRSMGLSVYEICNFDSESNKENTINFFRYRAIQACQRIVNISKSVVVVDEADTTLNSVPGIMSFNSNLAEKGQINRILDESTARIIWIVNKYDAIDDSTKRRFDYSIKFEKLTFKQRRIIWQHCLVKHGIAGCVQGKEIDALAADYEVSAGGIDVAVRNGARIYRKTKSKRSIVRNMRALIEAHLTVLDQDYKDTKNVKGPAYSIEGLNIKGDVNDTIALIEAFSESWENLENCPVRNMNMLLYGPPGSGKTEFVKFITRKINRRLIVRRASDLLNCYVGETEKLIKHAFNEAEHDKAVLFIDETDGMLWNREGASHSWEVTQVNELLTQMETFRGMVVCATNFRQVVDSAAIRRFPIKLEFDFLRPEGVLLFYKLYFKDFVKPPLSAQDSKLLRSLSGLTPGDFRTVYQKYFYVVRGKNTHEKLIMALKQELAAKGERFSKKMGFTL